MQYLQERCDKISVRINSIGGSVLDGYSIVSAIITSKIPCNTYIDGLAASIAGVIAVAGKKCYMMDYGSLMLHNPSGGNDKQVLALVKETLVTILSNRTSKTADEISAMMEKETWLSAKQAMEAGMVDEVINTGKKLKTQTTNLLELANIYNKALNQPNEIPMTKITNKLGLNDNASEDAIVTEIEKKESAIATLEQEKESLKNRLAALEQEKVERENAEKDALKNKATEMVNNAHKEGKLKKEELDNTILNASKDQSSFEFVQNMISRIANSKEAVKVFNAANVKNEEAEKENWTLRDWETKDPAGLKVMYTENRAKFKELLNDYNTKK